MKSAVYRGWVRHRRSRPAKNHFRYRVFLMWLDLDELPTVFRRRWFWSAGRPNLAWFRRSDHLGNARSDLGECVRDEVEARLGWRPTGPICLLTHLRYFGYVMNPVSFFYCFDGSGQNLDAVLAEVQNTPWGERHLYAVDGRGAAGGAIRARFPKAFHVSPFLPMDQEYRWTFSFPNRRLAVHMENHDAEGQILDATMFLERREISGGVLARTLLRHPFMTLKVVLAIYWQALRLHFKGCVFVPHPAPASKN